MKHVRKWLPVPPYDLPGMEGWLEEMAGKGLYLERLKSWTARFRRGKPRPLRFRIQPCCGREREFLLQKPPEDLVELFASFGWQCEGWASSSLVLFSTDDPEAPEPNPDPQTLELALEPSSVPRPETCGGRCHSGFLFCFYVSWSSPVSCHGFGRTAFLHFLYASSPWPF